MATRRLRCLCLTSSCGGSCRAMTGECDGAFPALANPYFLGPTRAFSSSTQLRTPRYAARASGAPASAGGERHGRSLLRLVRAAQDGQPTQRLVGGSRNVPREMTVN